MNSYQQPGEHLVLFEQGGATVAHVSQAALASESLETVRQRLIELVHGSRAGLIVDCRDLPAGAAEQIGPLLYDLMVLARRRSPRVELCVVGDADQSIGDGKTLLMPPRFETVEAAGELLGDKQTGKVAVRFANGQSSQEAIVSQPSGNRWLQQPLTQMALTALVILAVCGLVTYSAIASFRSPVVPRRRGNPAERVAIQGRVIAVRGQTMRDDDTAVVLAWPAYVPKSKFHVQTDLVFRPEPQSGDTSIAVTHVGPAGQFAFSRRDLTGAVGSDYCVLVISEQIPRKDPPAVDDLKKLTLYLDDPPALLRQRQYQLLLVPTDVDSTREQSVTLADDSDRATADKPPGNDVSALPGPQG